ncbi:hypothetical protein EIN_214360, partial [Entamoeba invadens IP1]
MSYKKTLNLVKACSVLFKGTFRDNIVAIKKMKISGNEDTLNNEFEKEVEMLDKFRMNILSISMEQFLYPIKDIKLNNLLVFSNNPNDKVNAKLTDFESARNVNTMMTNMTSL